MTTRGGSELMAAEQAVALADFARAFKAAARSVSLYPATHPSIQASLSRVARAAVRLAPGDMTLTVHPGAILIDGQPVPRPDPSIAELAGLLHERLIGALRIEAAATLEDWHALLLILARPPEELIAGGGVARAWATTGRAHFTIQEIDYAEVLRERPAAEAEGSEATGNRRAGWDRIIAVCLEGAGASLDERSIAVLMAAVDGPGQLEELLNELDTAAAAGGLSVGERAAALLQLLRPLIERAPAERRDAVLRTAAAAVAHLSPEMLLGLATSARGNTLEAALAAGVIEHMTDGALASFVAGSVVSARGATERLAQAFEALVPDHERKQRLLDLARGEAQQSPLGQEDGFDSLWQAAADMLISYSDTNYVSAEYARELSEARAQAIDVERVSDDPPERVQAWLATVDDAAVSRLDLTLLLDLLRIENDPGSWRELSRVVAAEIERRTLVGDVAGALTLTEAVLREQNDDGRAELRAAADSVMEALASGPLVRHLALQLRTIDDGGFEQLASLARAIGTRLIRPLAEVLSIEQHPKAIRRLRELLLGFGAAGRQSVEQLKNSSNPAVRRTAIDLLRAFGGRDALPELASMLDDQDPQVQREAIRAIVHLGTNEAYAVLERQLIAGSATRDALVQQLIELRDDKAIPLLCHVLNHTAPRGSLAGVHADIIEALGGLGPHGDSTRTLEAVLHRGEWWAPRRTAALRGAAAVALRRIGSPETIAVLENAARHGSRGVRKVARAQAAVATRRPTADTTTGRSGSAGPGGHS